MEARTQLALSEVEGSALRSEAPHRSLAVEKF